MRKGLKMIYCSGCNKQIWRIDIEGWCHECKKFYDLISKIPQETLEHIFFGNGANNV